MCTINVAAATPKPTPSQWPEFIPSVKRLAKLPIGLQYEFDLLLYIADRMSGRMDEDESGDHGPPEDSRLKFDRLDAGFSDHETQL